jgi:(S)-ureidoglycine aminohydrolase
MSRILPFGQTRTQVAFDHALICPDGHVVSPLPFWQSTTGVVLINPSLGAAPRGPRFVQYLAMLKPASKSQRAPVGTQRLLYVLDGKLSVDGKVLERDGFAWLPPDTQHDIQSSGDGLVLVFEKPYERLPDAAIPAARYGHLSDVRAEPFLGDDAARLSTLLPIEPSFDMAVNVFTYQPGATLPFVETHVMEHGLYMRSGQGIYRLSNSWYPVQKGDTIWMASYCPQWFVAMGKEPASYIYYKDIHRVP